MEKQIRDKFDQIASEYSSKYDATRNIFSYEKIRRMELLLDYAKSTESKSTLDAGCGPGKVLTLLKELLPDTNYIGVDLSYSMLKQAQSQKESGLHLIQARVEQLPFDNNSFDLIYALGVIDYVENVPQFFEAVRRILKPEGYFIFTYPNRDSFSRTFRTWLKTRFFPSQTAVSAYPQEGVYIDRLVADYGFCMTRRRYITFGNGLISFPWSVTLSQKMEYWCDQRCISRYLAWSCICVTQKNPT